MSRLIALAAFGFGVGLLAAGPPGLVAVPAQAQAQQVEASQENVEQPPGYRLGGLTVSGIWSHQSASRDGAAYLRIGNAGKEDDALIDASTPFAKRVELRGPLPGGEIWETGRVDAIPVPAGQVTVLTGTAQNLRLVGLRGLLSVGGTVPITLTFERAGAITVEARVLSANAAAAIIEKAMPRKERRETPGARGATPQQPTRRQ